MSKLNICLQEMYRHGSISKQFYLKHNVLLDADKHDNKFSLNSEKDHSCHSKILYNPRAFADKKALINTQVADMDKDKMTKIITVEGILRENTRCE